MNNQTPVALIYARVSTKKQDPMSQLIRCEEYCQQKGYIIERTFKDKFTGGGNFLQRPAMRELLEYAKKNIHKQYIVVFDDLKRFARDTKFHIELRTTFASNGLTPECLNYNFDDSPEGRFMETMFAAQNELERHQNRRQVIQKQRARLTAGYNAFVSPTGYRKVKKDPLHGTIDVPNEHAPAMKKALQMFACGELQTRKDVAVFLKERDVLGKQDAIRYLDTAKKFLSNVFYAGYIEYEPWDVARRKGHHKPLITLKEYEQIQFRLKQTDHVKSIRKDNNPEYPLRGFINCYYCKQRFTACKSRGRRGGLYHKYYCTNRTCALRTMEGVIKSVDKDNLHEQFKSLLMTFKISPDMHSVVHKVIKDLTKSLIDFAKNHENESEKHRLKLEEEIDVLVSRVADPNTSDIIREHYEKKIVALTEDLSKNKALDSNQEHLLKKCRTPLLKLLKTLQDPYKMWSEGNTSERQKLFYYLFDGNLEYQPNVGFRTPKKALPLRLLEQFSTLNSDNVKIPREISNSLIEFVSHWNTPRSVD